MAKRTWIGGAAAVAQVDTVTPGGTIEGNDVFNLTLTDESGATQLLSVVAGGTTVAAVTAAITAAWNASTLSLFARITAADGATKVTLTSKSQGVPFYLTVATTENGGGAADGQTVAHAIVTPNSGPSDWNCVANWTENTLPAAGNDVLLTGSSPILYGVSQASAVTGKFATESRYSGNIGGPGQSLSITPTSLVIEGGNAMYINVNAAAIPVRVAGGSRFVLNGSALTIVTCEAGTTILGVDPGDTPTLTTLSLMGNATGIIGPGSTITNFKQASGSGQLHVGATTVEAQGGTLTTYGAGAITTLTNSGGTVNSDSSGTVGTLNAFAGVTDLSRSRTPRTVTNLNLRKGATVKLDTTVVTVGTFTPENGLMAVASS